MYLVISQNSQENRDSFFNKFAANSLKKSLWDRCFPVNFTELLRTRFLQNTSRQLLLFLSTMTVCLTKFITEYWLKHVICDSNTTYTTKPRKKQYYHINISSYQCLYQLSAKSWCKHHNKGLTGLTYGVQDIFRYLQTLIEKLLYTQYLIIPICLHRY